ncbi:Trigger factor like [Actinidia chinensis var. chinensis]|uniref:peptidylprolyl isomerase n=1 Tax=Actinidia chinensis var. chinensis TaxID=1590841 RepID=A0A2R6RS19_ACTCC|nr:Trigger factor like [Actinidia chinensis var. chinensis]
MEIAINTRFLGFNPKIVKYKQNADVFILNLSPKRERFTLQIRHNAKEFHERACRKNLSVVCAVSSGVKDIDISTSQCEDFSFSAGGTSKANKLRISVKVSGAKTQAIFDDVFYKMVADAQPIPGFRRIKGGKTPDIPRDVLLQVLGPSKVYKQVIKKVINSTIAEYVEKESLAVTKDLSVEQSFEDLEAAFEPGDQFSFDAVLQLRELNEMNTET